MPKPAAGQDRAYRALTPADSPLASLDFDARFVEAMTGWPVVLGVSDRAEGQGGVQTKSGFVQIGDDPAAALPWVGAMI